ncbi:CheR family methyltransferase [Pacificoceanicola onchidii]|uniref:CheR family methyltransferase n=1 Tax=Pacificoceanicola onchidii TaxID=2562685 RepID=UPI0010A41C06|nr:protein-glutamate O-methyltransferase [Pacificoceanicola onchidii]
MGQLARTGPDQSLPFSDRDFEALAALAHREFGLSLSQSKKPLVYSRLSRRLKARGIHSFPDYLRILDVPGESSERLELISALTTNVTSFFREDHHFEKLRSDCLSREIEKIRSGKRFRVWSAGCSSGQEPFSIAMEILGSMPDANDYDVKVLATDIDPKIVSKAKSGRYSLEELQSIPDEFRRKWTKNCNDGMGEFQVLDAVRDLVTFGELNLMSDWPFSGPFDSIFCRNVAIYFDQKTQQKLWVKLSKILAERGFLFIGHSERVSGDAVNVLTGVGVTSYQKSTLFDPKNN